MFSPRWRKVVRDLWSNKTRTSLVVLSIAVGVFAVGSITHMNIISTRDLKDSYALVNPVEVVLYIDEGFDDELIQTVRRIDGVSAAEGRQVIGLRFKTAQADQWLSLQLTAISDYENMSINKVGREAEFAPDPAGWRGGMFPPPDRQIVLERSSIMSPMGGLGNAKFGDTIIVETASGRQREMRLAGLAYDFGNYPATFSSSALGFITPETAEWLGQTGGMNRLLVRVTESERTEAGIKRIADQVKKKIEKGGRTIDVIILRRPGEMPIQYYYQTITLLLGALAALSLFLCVFLVFNTVSAHIAQQVPQIGMMKAVGARAGQIATLYLGMVAIFGILALALAIPLGIYASQWFVNFVAYFMNFKLERFYIPLEVVCLDIALGVGVPLLAALLPVISGTRISVRQALSHYGIGESRKPRARSTLPTLPLLSRPLLLSLRNTFRRKMRMVLTLTALILAGTIFVSVFNIHASLSNTLESALDYYQSDLLVFLAKSYPRQRAEAEALNAPGIAAAEGWGGATTYRVRPNGIDGESVAMHAPPPYSQMIKPNVVEGRWLLPEDENATVIGTELVRSEPDLKVGGEVVFRLNGRETNWRIVGIVRTVMMGNVAYANYAYLTRVLRDVESAAFVAVVAERHDDANQAAAAKSLDKHLAARGLQVSQIATTAEIRSQVGAFFNIIIALLLAMALLMAAVGGLGLMATMGLSVLERTREIGVMRAIGASNGSVRQIVIVEGVLISLISWLASVILALPIGKVLGDAIVRSLFETPIDYAVSVPGALVWLLFAIILSVIASALPAHNATRVTVREVLAYE